MKPKRGRKIVDSNLLSDSSRAARNREYSRRHRAKCSGQREELRALKEEALPNLYRVIEETISTVERENSRPKTSQNLRQILCILHQLICGPGPVLPHQFERTQCPNQSNIAEASNSLAPAPVMHPQDSDFDLFFSLLNDDNHYSAGLTPSFLYASSSPGDMSTTFPQNM